jgi:hypothetical protein
VAEQISDKGVRMASEQHTKPLMDSINKGLEYQKKDLVKRNDWGSITFDKASHDLDRVR